MLSLLLDMLILPLTSLATIYCIWHSCKNTPKEILEDYTNSGDGSVIITVEEETEDDAEYEEDGYNNVSDNDDEETIENKPNNGINETVDISDIYEYLNRIYETLMIHTELFDVIHAELINSKTKLNNNYNNNSDYSDDSYITVD